VEVLISSGTGASRGEYLYTSDTSGKATVSTQQYDGLLGVVSDISGVASGYVKMIFNSQPQVTASATMDKASKHNEYWLYADKYSQAAEGSSNSLNLLTRGISFDTFEDITKTDSSNTTVSVNTYNNRMGLFGGQTLATSTTDNYGNTYLGSNTVNDIYFYDRTHRDSTPEVQAELGVDPNWYNGVTLTVRSDSTAPSTRINSNLSTTYNGSLLNVTGTYSSSPSTIYITIKTPTTFDWTDNAGAGSTAVTMTPGIEQALGSTGVYTTFTDVSYNTGDVFRIASWYTEPVSSTRGEKQEFPERAYLIATSSSVDIIDADTQKLWMRFSQGTNYALGSDTNNNPSGVEVLNGKLYVSTNGSSATGLYTIYLDKDSISNYDSTDFSVSNKNIAGRNNTNTYSTVNTTNYLVSSVVNDVDTVVTPNQPKQETTVTGWGYITGAGTYSAQEVLNFPYAFEDDPKIVVSYAGYRTANPENINQCTGGTAAHYYYTHASVSSETSAIVTAGLTTQSFGTMGTIRICYTWTATGTVSPKQFVAVGTGATGADGGTTIINETDGTKADVLVGSQSGNVVWQSNVALNNNTLYTEYSDATNNTNYLLVYYGAHSLNSETSFAQSYNGSYGIGNTAGYWTPVIAGASTGTNQINSLYVTTDDTTPNSTNNKVYVGTSSGVTVLTEKKGYGNGVDSMIESDGSVKYYTKDYISEEMIGDVRGMWPLNGDNTASDFEDVSIRANNLTATNLTAADTAPGVRGMALDFDGSTEYLVCSDASCGGSADLDPGGVMSMSVWVKPTSVGTIDMIAGKGSAYWMSFNWTDSGCAANKFGFSTYVGGWTGCAESSTIPEANKWYHLVATTDGTYIRLYVNGVLEDTVTGSNPADSTSNFQVGGYASDMATYGYNGLIEELFVTAKTLSASEIKHMYEVGYRALQSHSTTLGGGSADGNQRLGYVGVGTSAIGFVQPDWNNQYMYVGINSTTLGGLSKIDLASDTNVKTYSSSANVPTGGTLLIDEDVTSAAVGYNLEAVGSASSGVKTMGIGSYSTSTSGDFVGKTVTTLESFTQAYLWAQYVTDADDASNTIEVWASNDGGSNYYKCNSTGTNTNVTPTEYEYFCQFNSAGTSLKTKFVFARGSTKTNTMTVNDFNMTKDQHDHIRHLITSTPKNNFTRYGNVNQHLFPAIKYLRIISRNKAGMLKSKTDGNWYVLTVQDALKIAQEIESKL